MKRKLIQLSGRYLAELRTHLKPGQPVDLQPALKLGRRAVALGLETLGLARIHEQALSALKLSHGKSVPIKRAEIFFTEALTPIVETHRTARQSKVHLGQLMATLGQRTKELAVSNRQLQRGVVRRKVMEEAAEKRGKHHEKCLEESLELQKRLRELTHQALIAQEDDRTRLSHELQDEIAQTLLGINVRLLALKQHDGHDSKRLKNEIASAQRLVLKSAKSVRQFARKLAPHHSLVSAPSRSPLP